MTMLQFESKTLLTNSQARVEVATVVHNGHRFEALGAVVDHERGLVMATPTTLAT